MPKTDLQFTGGDYASVARERLDREPVAEALLNASSPGSAAGSRDSNAKAAGDWGRAANGRGMSGACAYDMGALITAGNDCSWATSGVGSARAGDR